MEKLERVNRLRMARDFAVQAENALLGLSMPRPHVGEQKALLLLGRSIAELGEAITSQELASKPHREGKHV